jgi:hypothetical protein
MAATPTCSYVAIKGWAVESEMPTVLAISSARLRSRHGLIDDHPASEVSEALFSLHPLLDRVLGQMHDCSRNSTSYLAASLP